MAKSTQKKKEKSPNSPKVSKNNEPVNEEKENLKKEISELNKLISRSKLVLKLSEREKITEFCDIKLDKKPRETKYKHKIKNWGFIYHHELDKLSGFYCTKSELDEFIFNFDITSSGNDNSIYGVQILTENDKKTIGKKIMPTIDFFDSLLIETPIEHTKDTVPFLKNCWRHLNCFHDRKLQVQELEKATEDIKNISVDADMGFNMVIIHLTSVYDKIQDNFLNLTGYFSYENGSTRPQLINVDWNLKNRPNEESTKAMKSFVKIFRKLPLHESLMEISQANHSNFSWEPEKRENTSTIDLQAVRDSEEDSESSEEVSRKKRKKVVKKLKRKRVASSQESEEDLAGNSQENDHLDLTVDKSKGRKSDSVKKTIKKLKKNDAKKPGLRQSLLNFERKPGPASKTKTLVENPPIESNDDTDETMKLTPKKKPVFTSTPMPGKHLADKLKKNPVVVIETSPISEDDKSKSNVSKQGDERNKTDDKKSKIPGAKLIKTIVDKQPDEKADKKIVEKAVKKTVEKSVKQPIKKAVKEPVKKAVKKPIKKTKIPVMKKKPQKKK